MPFSIDDIVEGVIRAMGGAPEKKNGIKNIIEYKKNGAIVVIAPFISLKHY